MTRNPNLVATPITDRNGKVTTVYRKPSGSVSASAGFPVPRVPALSDPQQVFTESLDRLAEGDFLKSNDPQGISLFSRMNLQNLATSSPETLVEVTDHILASTPQEQNCWEWALLSQNICDEPPSPDSLTAAKYRRAYETRMAVQPLVTRIVSKQPRVSTQASSEMVIYKMQELLESDYRRDESVVQGLAIYLSLRHLRDDITEITALTPDEKKCIHLLAAHIDSAERVVHEMVHRQSSDPQVIIEFLSSPSGLAKGAL